MNPFTVLKNFSPFNFTSLHFILLYFFTYSQWLTDYFLNQNNDQSYQIVTHTLSLLTVNVPVIMQGKSTKGLRMSPARSPPASISILRNYSCRNCYITKLIVKWDKPTPVAAGANSWVFGCSLVVSVGSNPFEGMDFFLYECVLFDRGLCVRLITLPEESYRVWCDHWG
jgi:hypothetical protein